MVISNVNGKTVVCGFNDVIFSLSDRGIVLYPDTDVTITGFTVWSLKGNRFKKALTAFLVIWKASKCK